MWILKISRGLLANQNIDTCSKYNVNVLLILHSICNFILLPCNKGAIHDSHSEKAFFFILYISPISNLFLVTLEERHMTVRLISIFPKDTN